MKKLTLAVIFCLFCVSLCAQNPTLSVGLDKLVMNKQPVDIEVVTQIIMEKQRELKQEALKRFMLALFPETGYTTRFYVQNSLNILLNEKNPQVIKKELLELTTNYALVIGIAKSLQDDEEILVLNDYFNAHKSYISVYQVRSVMRRTDAEQTVEVLKAKLKKAKDTLAFYIKNTPVDDSKYSKNVKALEKQRKDAEHKLRLKKLKENIGLNEGESLEKMPFSLLTDVVAASLSGMDELRDKGFFRKPINYKQDEYYKGLTSVSGSEDALFALKLDALQVAICSKIRPYIVSYEVIKEFYAIKNDPKNKITIKDVLIGNYVSRILEQAGGPQAIRNILPEKKLAGLRDNVKVAFEGLNELVELQRGMQEYANNLISLKSFYQKYREQEVKIVNALQVAPELRKQDTLEFKKSEASLDSTYAVVRKQFKAFGTVFKPFIEANDVTLPPSARSIDTGAVSKIINSIYLGNTNTGTQLVSNATIMIKNGEFLEVYLSTLLAKMGALDGFKVTADPALPVTEVAGYSTNLSQIYIRLNQYAKQESISLKDIKYIDEEVIPIFIRYAVIFNKDTPAFSKAVQEFRLLSTLLKIKAITDVGDIKNYDNQLINLFRFISNLDNLDHAESYQYILNLLQESNQKLEEGLDDSKFKDVYMLFSNAIRKYTIINTQDDYVSIDVVSFLTELQQYFDRNNNSCFGLYLTVGLNQNFFLNTVTLPGASEPLRTLGFASEKLGVKFRLHSFNRLKGYENVLKNDVSLNKRAPFVNQVYGILYGSGLLYSLANTATNTSFDYPHVGGGVGLRFYNALDVNVIVGMPFIKGQNPVHNLFLGLALDIPLGEYLEKLGSKNK